MAVTTTRLCTNLWTELNCHSCENVVNQNAENNVNHGGKAHEVSGGIRPILGPVLGLILIKKMAKFAHVLRM